MNLWLAVRLLDRQLESWHFERQEWLHRAGLALNALRGRPVAYKVTVADGKLQMGPGGISSHVRD